MSKAIESVDVRWFKNPSNIRDLFTFGGLGSAFYGLFQIYPPWAWIFTGCALFWLGVRR